MPKQSDNRFDNSIVLVLLATGCGLYGYGHDSWTGAGFGVIVGTVLGLVFYVILALIIDWADNP